MRHHRDQLFQLSLTELAFTLIFVLLLLLGWMVFAKDREAKALEWVIADQGEQTALTSAMEEASRQLVEAVQRAGGDNLAVRRAAGLAAVPSFLARSDLEAGRIEPVLLDWCLPEYRAFAVYPHRRFVSPKVRVFLEALTASFGDGTRDPWWPETVYQTAAAKPTTRRRTKRGTARA